MRTLQEHTATQRFIFVLQHRCLLMVALAAGILMPAVVVGQAVTWLHRAVPERGLTSSNTQVAIDVWGNTHVVWGSNDQDRSGIQLFYSTDATGTFSQPLQFTDAGNGTVFDSSVVTTPFQFRLDRNGAVHAAFIANRLNHLYLFYTTNRESSTGKPWRFSAADSLAEVTRYGLAVDSAGVAHIVWIEEFATRYDVRYHSSLDPPTVNTLIASVPCACRVGDPAVSVSSNALEVVFRADSGSLYYLRKPTTGSFGPILLLPTPQYDGRRFNKGTGDLRVASAVGATGTLHIVQPHYDAASGHRLLYLDNASGSFSSSFLTNKADTSARSFALAFDHQQQQLGVAWTQYQAPTANSTTLFQTLAQTSPALWTTVGVPTDVNAVTTGTQPLRRSTSSLFLRNGRVVIGSLAGSDNIRWKPAFYDRSSIAPAISYLLPDAAAPGMNVVVEAYAPYRQQGSFGQDGFQPNVAELQLMNPQDSNRVVVGPTVISWNGRLASTMMFVKAGAGLGAVPVRLRVGAAFSNVDTFFVVKPQHLGGSSGQLSGGGVLGSGGIFGSARSRRGVLVVDSLVLLSGTFTIDTTDTDPTISGNQGFLPVTILSRGGVHIGSAATLSVSAPNPVSGAPSGVAGPGGGGGGSGGQISGGSGYTGGGGASLYLMTNGNGESFGSGSDRSGIWGGGSSLNGTPGGATYPNATSGGGTGHPFGASAWYGRVSRKEPTEKNIGGFGGGAGGTIPLAIGDLSWGGGGGAFGMAGGDGDNFGQDSSGGYIVGSSPLVPIAGGSGGGAAFAPPTNIANGGGGGGALQLISYQSINLAGRVTANGADGVGSQGLTGASGGGGGAGGGILLASKGEILLSGIAPLLAQGGQGGIGTTGVGNNGGNGGDGRIRIDGRSTHNTGITPAPAYRGPALFGGSALQAVPGGKVIGSGMPGATIHLFIRSDAITWDYTRPLTAIVGSDSLWSITLGSIANTPPLFLVAMQQVANPKRVEFQMEPDWVMSPAAGGILGRTVIAQLPDTVDVGCIRFDSCRTYTIPISNIGDYSDLVIRDARITGDTVFKVEGRDGVILAGATGSIRVRFCPDSSKTFYATLTIITNTVPDTIQTIVLRGCGLSGILTSTESTMQLGELCPGTCVDTTVTFRNVGNAALQMEQITGDSIRMSVQVISGIAFPKRLEPGDSVAVRLRLCLRRIDPNGSRIYAVSNAIEPIYSELIVYATNAGPVPDVTDVVDFGNITLPATDPCITRSLTVRNQSSTFPLRMLIGQVTPPEFALLSPATRDTVIPPNGSVELIGKFCTNQVGTFRDTLRLTFTSGGCTLDTVVAWVGTASYTRPLPIVIRPILGDTLRFPAAIIGVDRFVDSIIILNTGNAVARLREPSLYRIVGTGVLELEVDNAMQPLFPYNLEPNQTVAIYLNFKPITPGEKKGLLVLQDSDGWLDTVVIIGQGISSNIRLNPTLLDFGDVRVGSVSDQKSAEVINIGDAPEGVQRVSHSGDTNAIVRTNISPIPPLNLLPAQANSLILNYQFAPTAEQQYEAFDTVVFAARTTLRLRGRGVLEHAAADQDTVDFGCQFAETTVDSANAILIRNTGTYPLTVDSLAVVEGSQWFQMVGGTSAIIPPQGSATFTVRYSPQNGKAFGKVKLFSSAQEEVEVQLRGDLCADTRRLSITVAETSGAIGDTASINIAVELNEPLNNNLPVSMTLSYSDDIITPLWDSGPIYQGAIPGVTVSSEGEGKMKISGEIPAMTTTGKLLTMPVRVLLGSTWFSPLRLTNVTAKIAGLAVQTKNARLLVLDCDTTGGIIFQGNYALDQNIPNPFNPTTTISYEIARQDHVRLTLYSPMGNRIATLIDEVQLKGVHHYQLDATILPSGVYTYELQSGPFRKTRRMVVME